MTVRTRLVLALVGIVAVLVVPALYGIQRLDRLRDTALDLRERHAAAWVELGRVQTALGDFDRSARSYLARPDSGSRASMRRALARAEEGLAGIREAGYAREVERTAALLDALEAAARRLEDRVAAGELGAATDLFAGVPPLVLRARQSLAAVDRAISRRGGEAADRAERISREATRTTVYALAAALFLALLVGISVTRALTSPLERLRRGTARVAGGDFEAPADLDYGRGDELGQLNRSFRTMTERLQELSRLRAEFVSMASHKLKTPVNVLRGYAEMLRDELYGEVTGEQREVLQEMEEQSQLLVEQVDKLMELSRAEAGALELELETVHLDDLLQGLELAFRPLARQKEAEFVLEKHGSAPEAVRADPDLLRDEVVGNFVSNAFKFVPEGGEVRVEVWGDRVALSDEEPVEPAWAILEVTDTGPGIPAGELEHVFERYYQVEAEAREMGTGLGLAIAREVVEAHRGHVVAESEEGAWTTFRVWLPVAGPGPEGTGSA